MNFALYRRAAALFLASVLAVATPSAAVADEVLDWNVIAVRAMQVAPAVPGPLQARLLAIVHASIFDAVNGIDRLFTPIHVDAEAPRDASRRAAAVQAAHTVLVSFFPSQAAALNADLEASLAGIAADTATENSESIQRGRDWGAQVALAILAWRENDGLNPPAPTYLGREETGIWRPTPRPNPDPSLPELPGLPGLVPSLAYTQPFVIPSPSSFRPAGPPPLTSQEYADDVNEVQSVGALVSATRTADQTESARFWAGAAASVWNRAAVSAARQRNTTLSQNARLFALLNIAAADTIIAAWDAKYYFEFWRPITAIRLASTDGNPATIEQSDWVPLIVNPPYPEYFSGHQAISGSEQAVLKAFFGDAAPFEAFSEGLPGVIRSWPTFSSAAAEASLARIWAGIHFRFTMRDTLEVGEQIAAYVLAHAAQPLHDQQLVASHSQKCLDVPGWSTDDGAAIIQWQCNGGNNQAWILEPADDGYSRLVSRHSGKCLDVAGESTEDGASVIQWQCHGGANQQWRLEAVPGGHRLVARHSGKCLDVAAFSADDGASIIQWQCHGGANQTWVVDPVTATSAR